MYNEPEENPNTAMMAVPKDVWYPRYRVIRWTPGKDIPDDEPCLIIRGQDILAPSILNYYLSLYQDFTDHDPQVVAELNRHMLALREWQQSHRIKLADR